MSNNSAPITMNKLYIGNLPTNVDENQIKHLFDQQSLAYNNILVKRGGFAFVDCPDQSAADKAIDKLNGFNFNGSVLNVEPSVGSIKKRTNPELNDAPIHIHYSNGRMREGRRKM
ncbi:insulin-like growth factor 2 mRNA-binding protein 3-A [Aethina tumida]|uniref:insulin-like growth factor 2 mRNA-binding protein 3-A n=1 Tax=Aethina tumida TaxID=116153 RepID=UPI002147A8E1|nr:insulin-like growth factor 2 mRNA-binding protein 3-A [Aethina tumida]